MEYYVYVWKDASGVPFYVGKGKADRAYKVSSRSAEFLDVHRKGGCSVEIVDWFIHESQALAFEAELIAKYGRKPCGPLVNKTDGGDGANGFSHGAETRAKMSRFRTALYRDPAARLKMSEAKKGQKPSAKTIEATIASNARRYSTASGRRETAAHMRFEPPRSNNTTGYKGVFKVLTRSGISRWRAQITSLEGGRVTLGTYSTPEEAARAYDDAAIDMWGRDNCYVNLPIASNDNRPSHGLIAA